MRDIFIKTKLFIFNQSVIIRNNETGATETYSIPLDEIIDFVSTLNDVDTIHLSGNEKYIEQIKKDFTTRYPKPVKFTINGR